MSRFRKVIEQGRDLARKDEAVINFMEGESYRINALDTLKMITASSIFGEPAYYRAGGLESSAAGRERGSLRIRRGGRPGKHAGGQTRDQSYRSCALLDGWLLLGDGWDGRTTTQIMEQAIDDALTADFEGTLRWAVTLRESFYMRLDPQVIMVRAALHPGRKAFTSTHPGQFDKIQQLVMSRADDAMSQLAYFLHVNKGKQRMPSILKRSIARRLGAPDAYEAAKYKMRRSALRMDRKRTPLCQADDRSVG